MAAQHRGAMLVAKYDEMRDVMRDKIKLVINLVLVCITIERALAELSRERKRNKPGVRSALEYK